jgi:hypothetical protein
MILKRKEPFCIAQRRERAIGTNGDVGQQRNAITPRAIAGNYMQSNLNPGDNWEPGIGNEASANLSIVLGPSGRNGAWVITISKEADYATNLIMTKTSGAT